LPVENKLVDAASELGESEALGDGEVKHGAVDSRLSEEVLTQAHHRADTEVLGHLPDAVHGVAGDLQLAGVDETKHREDGYRRVLRQVDGDHLARRKLGELLNQILAVRRQRYLQARTVRVTVNSLN